jgi:tRNA pseudouridine38-40 synthase
VQGALEQALSAAMGLERVPLAGAGRTDAGVHARGQVASFAAATRLPARALPPLLNRRLPGDVRVQAACEVAADFHARHSALGRRYAYRLLGAADPLLERFAWHPGRRFDLDRLTLATAALEGEHDFSAFRSAGSAPTVSICTLARARWSREGALARFDVVADHFLYRMVRNIVGTALTLASEPDPAAAMRAVLESRARSSAGVTAPAHGLCLEQVFYPPQVNR